MSFYAFLRQTTSIFVPVTVKTVLLALLAFGQYSLCYPAVCHEMCVSNYEETYFRQTDWRISMKVDR